MSDIIMKCIFCEQETCEKIIKFTSKTFKKCTTVLEYRRSKPVLKKRRTTYNTIGLSAETSLSEGYHAQCYKLFTAIKIPSDFQSSVEQQSAAERDNAPEVFADSSELHVPVSMATQATGTSTDEVSSNFEREFEDFDDQHCTEEPVGNEDVPTQKCFICEKTRKRLRGREVPLAINKFQTIETLKSTATEYNDTEMLEKINSFSDSSKIHYHKCCKDQYLRDISREESEFLKKRKASNTAYTMLCEILEKHVVKNNKCLFLDHVKKEYHVLLLEQSKQLSDSVNSSSFSDRHLERKLMDTFNKKIKIIYADKKKFLAPFSVSFLSYSDLFKTMAMKETIR